MRKSNHHTIRAALTHTGLSQYERQSAALTKLDALIAQRAAGTSRIFAWAKQSEIDASRTYGGSFNAWLEKHDCNVQLFDAPQPAPSTSPLTDEQIEAIVQKEMAPAWATMKTFARAIEAAHKIGAKP